MRLLLCDVVQEARVLPLSCLLQQAICLVSVQHSDIQECWNSPWRFWNSPEKSNLNEREPSLDNRGHSPRPVVVEMLLRAVARPRSQDGAQVIHRPEGTDPSVLSTVLS